MPQALHIQASTYTSHSREAAGHHCATATMCRQEQHQNGMHASEHEERDAVVQQEGNARAERVRCLWILCSSAWVR